MEFRSRLDGYANRDSDFEEPRIILKRSRLIVGVTRTCTK